MTRTKARNHELRLPPQDLVAERSVLGCIMLQDSCLDDVADFLQVQHFYADVHGIIFAAMLKLHEDSTKIDSVTLANALDQASQLDDVGGVPYLLEVLDTVPYSAHVKYYAEIVRDKWIQRSLTQQCDDTLRDCYESSDDTPQILDRAEQRLFGILESQEGDQKTAIKDLLIPTLQRISARMEKRGVISGLPSGFNDLDRLTNGFQESELIILAARPSMGKTALVCNIAEWSASVSGTTTLIFSLEQSKLELVERFMCIRSRVDGHKLRKGEIDETERHAILQATEELERLPLHIDDKSQRTVTQISAICRRHKRRNNLGLVIIDYLQLIEPEDKRANREQQIAQITRRLKGIAKDCSVPLIALSQLNRGVELREDKRPRLSDLRESGAIEQDADIVMFLHRPEHYVPDDRPGLAEIIVAKHRSGPTGVVNLQWRKESMRFTDYDPIDSVPQF